MGNKLKILSVLVVAMFIATTLVLPTYAAAETAEKDAINKYIKEEVKYDPDVDISANTGCEQKPMTYTGDDTKTVTIKYTKKTASADGTSVLANSSAIESKTYPGSMIKGNKNVGNNNPDIISISRTSMNYTIDLAGISSSGFTADPNSYSSVRDNITAKCDQWASTGKEQPYVANYNYTECSNTSQTSIDLNVTAEQLAGLGIGVGWEQSSETTTFVVSFTQVYYTVSVQLPSQPCDYFGDSVTVNDVKNVISNNSQGLVVQSVSYGRTVLASVTSSESSDKVTVAIEAAICGTEESLDQEYKDIINQSTTKLYVYGGPQPSKTPTTITEVVDYIEDSKITASNIYTAKPIQYNTAWIDNNSTAVSNSTAEYTEKTVQETIAIDYTFRFNGAYEGESWLYYTTWDSINSEGKKVNERNVELYNGLTQADHTISTTITAKHNPDMYLTVHAYGNDDACTKKLVQPLESLYYYHGGTICDQTFWIEVDGVTI